jgi:hypothetical protein
MGVGEIHGKAAVAEAAKARPYSVQKHFKPPNISINDILGAPVHVLGGDSREQCHKRHY